MLVAKYEYKDVAGETVLQSVDLDKLKLDKSEEITAEDLIEIVASKLEGKSVEIVYEIFACQRGGERNSVPKPSVLAAKYNFTKLSLYEDGKCLLIVL